MSDTQSFLAGLPLSCLWMFFLWLTAIKIRNASIVDIGWALNLVLLTVFFGAGSQAPVFRQALAMGVVSLWGGRLAWHLGKRILALHPEEEGRYKTLRQNHASHANRFFFFFFQAQGIIAWILSLPLFFILRNPSPEFSLGERLGFLFCVLGILGEHLADTQLKVFKKAHPGEVCDAGLWRYSRHPNYFFECLYWVGLAIVSSFSPDGLWGWEAAILMVATICFVTGIPPTESQSLKSRGEKFREYQKRTSVFFPWPPKK